MSVKVAIASSDGLNIDLHFGQASQFRIYELRGDHFEFLETRDLPKSTQPEEDTPAFGGGCGGGGFGCGGGATGPLAPAVELLLDCRAVVAAQIGQGMGRQFARNAVSVFDIELPIEEALQKLAAYYLKFGD